MDPDGSSIRGYHPGDHIPGNRFSDREANMIEIKRGNISDILKMDPDKEIRMTPAILSDILAGSLQVFTEDCLEMAEKNWTPGQYQQLEWVVRAVLEGKEYPTKNRAEKNNSADGFMKELREYKKHIEGEFIPWNLVESTYKRLKEADNGSSNDM